MAIKRVNYFEQELKKIFGDSEFLSADTIFSGRAMVSKIDKDLRAKVEFVTFGYADHYEGLQLSIINRTQGTVDVQRFRFSDIIGWKNNDRPYIWDDRGTASWYNFIPTMEERKSIQSKVEEYIGMYAGEEMGYAGPRMDGM